MGVNTCIYGIYKAQIYENEILNFKLGRGGGVGGGEGAGVIEPQNNRTPHP